MNKKFYPYIFLGLATLSLTGCNEWLEEETPGITRIDDYFNTGSQSAAENIVNSAYTPLQWDYGTTYCAEWFIGDIASDDALKGGQNISDGGDYYDIDNFKVQADNAMLLNYWRAQWIGISRANLAINKLPEMKGEDLTDALRTRLLAEAHFLRAYYYFRLVRVFGGMPIVDYIVDSSNKWYPSRASVEDCYDFIVKDLEEAEKGLELKSAMGADDLGRATKGAAQAMLMKVALYRKDYPTAKSWGEKVVGSGEYNLFGDYYDNFTLPGENGIESVFEIQYMEDDMSDYGGFGFTRGTFTQILTRSRSNNLGGGWGFNRPTQNLYDEYEPADPRRDMTILKPALADMTNEAEETYCGNVYISKKNGWYNKDNTFSALAHHSRGPLNNRQIRYSDVLLMYAEALTEVGTPADLVNAKNALNQVRSRVGLTPFPYSATIQKATKTFADTQADLRAAIRHERRVELGMEGHRWFDLVRWGIAKQTMDAYIAQETEEAQQQWGTFVEGKNEIFPIPTQELQLGKLTQNPNY